MRVNRPVYALQLRALPHVVDDLRALRGALKRLKRDLGFQCLSVVEVELTANKQRANKIIERMRSHRLELCVYYLFGDRPVFALSNGRAHPGNNWPAAHQRSPPDRNWRFIVSLCRELSEP
jgi:hypothetical protein